MTDLFSAGDLPETHKPKPLAPLMLKDEILSVDQAAYVVGKSTKTIRDWNDEHVIGQQSKPGAPLEISWIALLMVANGDLETLERFRLGDRHSWQVVRYFDTFGLSGAEVLAKRKKIEKRERLNRTDSTQGLLIEHESDPLGKRSPSASNRTAAHAMRSLQSQDWSNEMDEAAFDDRVVQIGLNGGRVLDTFRSALFSAAGREGVSVNEFVLRSAGERLQRDGYRFNGVFEIDDLPGEDR